MSEEDFRMTIAVNCMNCGLGIGAVVHPEHARRLYDEHSPTCGNPRGENLLGWD